MDRPAHARPRKSPAGRIVNLSSILGAVALQSDPKSPIYGMKAFAYDASKTALNAFTVHLAHELRDTPIMESDFRLIGEYAFDRCR